MSNPNIGGGDGSRDGAAIFAGQVAVVTGAGSGLGRAHALLLARLGASVVVNDLGVSPAGEGAGAGPAETVVAEIRAAGGVAVPSFDTVATASGGAAIVATALDHFGRLDVLISNAGFLRSAPFEDMPDAAVDALIDVHLKSAFYLGRPAFRAMKARGYGRLLFTASSGGLFGSEGNAAYGAAKAGLIGVMNAISIEGAPFGILSNMLVPVSTTRLTAEGVSSYLARIQRAIGTMPPARPAAIDPSFVAPLAAYLVSPLHKGTQGIYSAALGRYARVFIGLGEGWLGPCDAPATTGMVAEHFAAIESAELFTIPHHLAEEFEAMARAMSEE